MIEFCNILEVADEEGGMHLLIGLKYTVIVTDNDSLIRTTPQSTRLVFCETKVPIQDRGIHTSLWLLITLHNLCGFLACYRVFRIGWDFNCTFTG